jgi:lipopolysaccharide export system ATP-binding protein
MALLEARGLVKQYGRRRVVDGVDFTVNAGEVVGLLGSNGAGKTTSFRMVTGLIKPNSGQVFLAGTDVTYWPMYRRARLGMGYLSQETSVFRKLTVEQNLLAILETMPVPAVKSPGRYRRAVAVDLLEQFGLVHLKDNMALSLSGGERRRLEIARCLVTDPALILLDEPFTGIDPKTIADIQDIVRALRNEGIGILLTDHNVAETLRITDRTYVVLQGKVIAHGPPDEIVHNEQVIQVYLGRNFQGPSTSAA